jgi:uncharacterized membrane protein YhfC
MSVSWLNYLPGIAMLAVGFGSAAIWLLLKRERRSLAPYFLLGAVLWAIAIAPKYVMDFTITTPSYYWMARYLPPMAMLAILSLYVGLRTGLFESGFSYLILKYSGLARRMGFDGAAMLGIGFGGIEAIFIGALWLVGPGPLLVSPLDPLSYLGAFERLFTLFCHVFATVLVVYSVKRSDLRLLGLSIAYKTALDGALYPFQNFFGTGLSGTLIIEGYVAVMGILGLLGLYWMAKKFDGGLADARQAGDPDTGH